MNKPHASLLHLASAAACAAAFVVTPASLRAANYTWTGNSTSLGMGNATNWGGTTPVFDNTADLQFPTSSVTNINMWVGGNRTVRSLNFGSSVVGPMGINIQDFNGGVAINLTMQAATGNASITLASGSSGNVTLGNATSTSGGIGSLILGSNLDVVQNGSGNLVINRPITGGFGVTKTGTGTLELRAFNTLTGPINVNEGKVLASSFASAGQDLNTASAVNLNGGTLQIRSTGVAKTYATVPLAVNAASTLIYENTSNTTFNAAFSGTSSLPINGNLTFQNTSSNTTLTNALSLNRSLTGSANIIVESYANPSSPSDNPTVGRLSLGGSNAGWSGDLIIRQGSAGFGGNLTLSSAGTGKVYLGETGNANGAGLVFSPFGFTGVTMVSNNDIIVRSGGYRTLYTTADNLFVLNGNLTLQGDLTITNANFFNTYHVTLNGNVTGPGGLTIAENGTTVGAAYTRLAGNNSYSGGTTVSTNATLSVASPSGNAIPDGSPVLLASGALLALSSNETIGSLASVGSNGTVALNGVSGLVTGANNQSTSFGGGVSGTGGLTKVGTGTMTMTGATTYSGNTSVSVGTLKLGSSSNLGFGGLMTSAPAGTIVSDGATLDLNGTTVNEIITLSGSGAGGSGALINSSATPAVLSNGVVGLTLASGGSGYGAAPGVNISGTGTGANATTTLGVTMDSFVLTNGGTGWVVGDTFTVDGGGSGAVFTVTGVSSGAISTYELTSSGSGYVNSPATLSRLTGTGSGATISGSAVGFTVTGFYVTAPGSGYTGTPTFTFNSGNATAGAVVLGSLILAADTSVGGAGNITIQTPVTESGGARSLNKVGAGTLTLAAPEYSGNTTVTSGRLSLGAPNAVNQASTVSIASGAVLELNFAGSDTVDKLFLAGVQQPAGTYTSAHGSGAFLGGGSLVVTSSPVSADTQPPVITLNGSASVSVNWGSAYSDAGATATDNVDTVVTVSTSGSVNTAKPGVYTLTYNASDVANNAATPVTRTVTVTMANASTPGADGLSPLMRYAFGANGPSDTVQAPVTSATATELKLTAVVRTDDANLTVTAETNTDLAVPGSWTGTGITESLAADQTNLPAGCVRRVYSVSITGAAKKFLRIKASSTF